MLLSTTPGPALNVTAFGVVGDGVTNNYAALNAAVAAAQAAGEGLYFPNGTYIYIGNLNAPNVPFYGQSQQAILDDPYPTEQDHNISVAQNITFEDFPIRDYNCPSSLNYVDCNFVSTVNDPSYYLIFTGGYVTGENVQFTGCMFTYNNLYTALTIYNYDSVLIQDCMFNPGDAGSSTHNVVLAQPNVPDAPTQILDNTIYGGATGILVQGNRQSPIVGGLIEGNHCYDQSEESISLDGFGNDPSLVPVIANGPISSVSNNVAGQLVVGMDDMVYVNGAGAVAPAPLSLRDDWTNFYFSFGQGSGLGGTLAQIVSFDPSANTFTLGLVAPASSVTVGGDGGVQAGFFNWTIENNYIEGTLGTNNTYGTAISAYLNVFGTTIENNVIENCAHGVDLAGGLMLSEYEALAYNNIVSNNSFIDCDQYGTGDPSDDSGVIRADSYYGGSLQYNNQFIDNTIQGGRIFLQAQANFTWKGNLLENVQILTDEMTPVASYLVEDGQSLPNSIDHFTVQFSQPMGLQSMIDDGSIVGAVSLEQEMSGQQQQAIPLDADEFSYNPISNTLTWQLPAGQSLPAGGYQLQISGALDANGAPLSSNFVTTFRSAAVTYSSSASLAASQTFIAASSSDGATYEWDFGDQTSANGASVSHTYTSLGAYTITLTATDANGSYQRTLTVIVNPATASLILPSPSTSRVYDGTRDVLSWAQPRLSGVAGLAAPTGAMSLIYYAGSSPTGSPLSSPPVNAGVYTVVGTYAGDGNYYPATSNAVTFTIDRAASSTTLATPPASITVGGTNDVTSWVQASVSGIAGGSLPSGMPTYTYYAGSAVSAAGGAPLRGLPTTAGMYTVVANYGGDTNYLPSSFPVTFTIQPAAALTAALFVNGLASTNTLENVERSQITTLAINFSASVALGADALSLTDQDSNNPFGSPGADVPFELLSSNAGATYTLMFPASLPDGHYVLTVNFSQIGSSNASVPAGALAIMFQQIN